jgi:predicted flap endonuclease-1-like 5' DNA nuclease
LAWFDEFSDMKAAGERTAKAFQAPVGLASPLWFAFGAAASVGVAYWWMTRWAKPVNVEALAESVAAPVLAVLEPMPMPKAPAKIAEAVIADVAKDAKAVAAVVAEAAPIMAPTPVAAPVAKAAPVKAAPAKAPKVKAPPPPPDDLTVMNGIGAKLSEHLAARGVTRFAHIAKWTEDDLAEIDKALSLKGRAVREAWVAQAKRFAKAK